MLKKYTSYYLLSFFFEALLGAGALLLAEFLGDISYLRFRGAVLVSAPGWLYLAAALGLPLFLYLARAHSFPFRAPLSRLSWPTAKAVLALVVVVVGLSFALKSYPSRLVILFFGLIAYGLALGKQAFLELLLARSLPHRQILLVGNSESARHFIGTLQREWPSGIGIFGLLTDEPGLPDGAAVAGVKVIGRVEAWEKILLNNQAIDEVVIFPNGKMGVSLNRLLRLGQELQVGVRVAVVEPEAKFNPSFERFGWTNLISFRPNPDNFVSMFFKRALDRAGAGVLLLVLSPLLLVLAFLIKIGSSGPVFFPQERMGLRGRPFRMFKFRTMEAGAERRKGEFLAANEMNGPVFKIKNDPRITGIGRWLRRFSLDELPQLINVFRGEMSLVGPRPLPLAEAQRCDRWEKRRFSVKPGITCLWQVNGRNTIDFPEWMKLDLEYVNNWSLLLDFRIMARTFGAVLSGRGAY